MPLTPFASPGRSGRLDYSLPVGNADRPVYRAAVLLDGAAAKSVTVPVGANVAVFAATGEFWARYDGAAASVPATDVTDGTSPDLCPGVRSVTGLAALSLAAPEPCTVQVSFFA